MATDIDSTIKAMVKYDLPGCPEGLIVQKVREVAEDFFRRSTAWRQDLDTFVTVADQAEYTLTPPTNCIIGVVTKVTLDESEKHQSRYDFRDDSVLEFTSAPTEDDIDVVVSVIVFPTNACASYPDEVIDRWQRALADGVLGKLKSDPMSATKPADWFEPAGGGLYSEKYEKAVANALNEMTTERKPDNVQVVMPYFA